MRHSLAERVRPGFGRHRFALAAAVGVTAVALAAAGCGGTSSSSGTGGTPVTVFVATYRSMTPVNHHNKRS
jgi:hypothetical protein